MRRALAVAAIALTVLVAGGAAADTFTVHLVSQTSSTITLGWDPQPGFGYRFYRGGVFVSSTNDPSRTTVKFSKITPASYDIKVITEGAGGHYPATVAGPTAEFTMFPSPAAVGQNVTFDWTGTCAAGGCGFVWEDEGTDGPGGTDFPLGTGDPYTRAFSVVGTKFIHLTVTDSGGAAAESRQQLTVGSSPPPTTQCSDGIDNADPEDTLVDLDDPGCSSSSDDDETNTPPSGSCDLNATPSNFSTQVSAASAGQTVCLASGNYGTWGGTNKQITVAAATGASPQMQVNFGTGDSGFTLDGMTGMGGGINGVANVTIRNSVFTNSLDINGSNVNVVLDHNTHNWAAVYSGGINAKIYLGAAAGATLSAPQVTIRNSEIKNGDLDGIHIGSGSGYLILNNTFDNLCDRGTNHTDNLQFDTTVITQTRIAGNYVHGPGTSCETQGITSYDHGTNGVVIENNVVDVPRPWGIELYADVNSVVRHNTLIFHPSSACFFNTTCGKINVTNKSGDPVSTGTQVYDNLAVADIGSCTGCSVHHNVSSQNAVYVGPQTFHDGFLLSPSSPVGVGAASDGTNNGVYATG